MAMIVCEISDGCTYCLIRYCRSSGFESPYLPAIRASKSSNIERLCQITYNVLVISFDNLEVELGTTAAKGGKHHPRTVRVASLGLISGPESPAANYDPLTMSSSALRT